jgi:peroxiredoxin
MKNKRFEKLLSLCLVIVFSISTSFSQKKSSSKSKKNKSSKSRVKKAEAGTVFLDSQNNVVTSKDFADFIATGEFGFENVENNFTKLKLKPISEVKLLDENEKSLTSQEFKERLTNDGVGFEPNIENGKVIGLKIRKYFLHGQSAPEFSIKTLNGEFVNLKEQNGKILVINFWFIGCVPCMEEMPALNIIAAKFKAKSDVIFLAIATDSEPMLKKFLIKQRFDFQIATTKKTDVLDKYKPNSFGFPTTIIIDNKGKIVFGLNSLGTDARLLDLALQKLLQ